MGVMNSDDDSYLHLRTSGGPNSCSQLSRFIPDSRYAGDCLDKSSFYLYNDWAAHGQSFSFKSSKKSLDSGAMASRLLLAMESIERQGEARFASTTSSDISPPLISQNLPPAYGYLQASIDLNTEVVELSVNSVDCVSLENFRDSQIINGIDGALYSLIYTCNAMYPTPTISGIFKYQADPLITVQQAVAGGNNVEMDQPLIDLPVTAPNSVAPMLQTRDAIVNGIELVDNFVFATPLADPFSLPYGVSLELESKPLPPPIPVANYPQRQADDAPAADPGASPPTSSDGAAATPTDPSAASAAAAGATPAGNGTAAASPSGGVLNPALPNPASTPPKPADPNAQPTFGGETGELPLSGGSGGASAENNVVFPIFNDYMPTIDHHMDYIYPEPDTASLFATYPRPPAISSSSSSQTPPLYRGIVWPKENSMDPVYRGVAWPEAISQKTANKAIYRGASWVSKSDVTPKFAYRAARWPGAPQEDLAVELQGGDSARTTTISSAPKYSHAGLLAGTVSALYRGSAWIGQSLWRPGATQSEAGAATGVKRIAHGKYLAAAWNGPSANQPYQGAGSEAGANADVNSSEDQNDGGGDSASQVSAANGRSGRQGSTHLYRGSEWKGNRAHVAYQGNSDSRNPPKNSHNDVVSTGGPRALYRGSAWNAGGERA